MLRPQFTQLVAFSSAQRYAFNLKDWVELCQQDETTNTSKKTMGAMVKFLAGASWYGHQEDLMILSEKFHPGATLSELVNSSQLDLSKFSNHLKEAIRHA